MTYYLKPYLYKHLHGTAVSPVGREQVTWDGSKLPETTVKSCDMGSRVEFYQAPHFPSSAWREPGIKANHIQL